MLNILSTLLQLKIICKIVLSDTRHHTLSYVTIGISKCTKGVKNILMLCIFVNTFVFELIKTYKDTHDIVLRG